MPKATTEMLLDVTIDVVQQNAFPGIPQTHGRSQNIVFVSDSKLMFRLSQCSVP